MHKITVSISIFAFLLFILLTLLAGISFNKNCGNYLELASNSANIPTAIANMNKAMSYLEANNLTSGYTSILYNTPDEDLGYWYNNLKQATSELSKTDSATSLEQTNMLMRFRETLIEGGEKGDNLIIPQGISLYPNNLLYAFLGWGSFLILFGYGIASTTDSIDWD